VALNRDQWAIGLHQDAQKAVHGWVLKDIVKWLCEKIYVMDLDWFELKNLLCFGDPFMYDYEPPFLGIESASWCCIGINEEFTCS